MENRPKEVIYTVLYGTPIYLDTLGRYPYSTHPGRYPTLHTQADTLLYTPLVDTCIPLVDTLLYIPLVDTYIPLVDTYIPLVDTLLYIPGQIPCVPSVDTLLYIPLVVPCSTFPARYPTLHTLR